MLNKKAFKCERCADCCKKYIIKLYSGDIGRIGEKYPAGYFLEKLEIGNISDKVLRKINGKCIFLKNNLCEIYAVRPKICRQYPFFGKKVESCKPVTMGKP